MKVKWKYFLPVIALSITFTKADEIPYLEFIDSLNPLKLLKGLEQNFDTNTSCKHDIEQYLSGLSSDELWALQMFDSSAKIGEGFLLRPYFYLGQYDECVAVEHPDKNFTGQHCMLHTVISLGNDSTVIPKLDNNTMTLKINARLVEPSKMVFNYGICLPSTCLRPEINATLGKLFNNTMFEGNISMMAPELVCHTKESSPPLNTGFWVTIIFLIIIAAVALLSTYYDVYQKNVQINQNSRFPLTFFSLYKNGKQLFDTKASDQLKMLNGMRVFSIFWVILHNGYVIMLWDQPVNDRVGLFKEFIDHDHIILTHGYIAVDTFFFLSGLLAAYVFFQEISKKGFYDVPMAYIHRYIRLTPPYAVITLIIITLYPYFGDGPLWDYAQSDMKGPCQKNWWLSLLYLDNFKSDWKCNPPTWYLPADMQLHWISPIILYPLYFSPSLAPIILGAVILVAAFITFTNAYVNNLGPSIEITTNVQQWWLDYKPFHTRAAPWFIGLAVGYAIWTIKAKRIKIQLTKIWVLLGWLAGAGLCLGSLYGVTKFSDYKYTKLQAASYLAFHRVGWGLGLSWIVFACVYGYGGPVNTFLSWNVFQPLAKLTYGAFLVHWPVIYYRIGTSRTNVNGNDVEMAYFFMGDVILSFLAAILLALLFEIPFRNMYKHFFQKVKILPFPRQKKQKHQGGLEQNNIFKLESREGKEKV